MSKETTLTSADLIKRSEELRRQAEEMMRKETPDVIARIKEAISHYGLTAADLGLGGAGGAGAGGAAKAAPKVPVKRAGPRQQSKPRRSAAVTYRDDQGHSWSGFGPKPRWLKEALAKGVSEESLRA